MASEPPKSSQMKASIPSRLQEIAKELATYSEVLRENAKKEDKD